MTVLLRSSADTADISSALPWLEVGASGAALQRDNRLPAAELLDDAFSDIAEDWWEIAQSADGAGDADLSHGLSCASYVSDLGVMLAWTRIVGRLASGPSQHLVICDDPWLFRQLRSIARVKAGKAPPVWPVALRLAARGVAARMKLSARLFYTVVALRRHRRLAMANGAAMIVYSHPASAADGRDAYFGELLNQIGGLTRFLHTDCGVRRARELGVQGKALSLHAWGTLSLSLSLVFRYWRPTSRLRQGKFGWLVRRAAAFEASRAAAAATFWQTRCQRKWMRQIQPRCIVWPWENHAWERSLVRDAKDRRIQTLGYQHTVVGRQIFNYSPKSNRDGLSSVPDTVLCNGPATRTQLETLGIPADRLRIAGAWRLPAPDHDLYDPNGPVFVAMSSDAEISRQLLSTIRAMRAVARRFLVKEHPMYPMQFATSDGIARTDTTLIDQKGVSAVIYATGAVGVEALLAGLPTLRFLPEGRVAIDILPSDMTVVRASAAELEDALDGLTPPSGVKRDAVVAPIDLSVWSRYLQAA